MYCTFNVLEKVYDEIVCLTKQGFGFVFATPTAAVIVHGTLQIPL